MELQEVKILFEKTACLKKFTPIKVELLKGDASGRKYSRIFLNSKETATLILMEVVGGKGPSHSGKYEGDEDKAFLEIADLFKNADISVPEVIFSDLDNKLIITTDAGNYGLNEFCDPEHPNPLGDLKERLFKDAVEILNKLQNVPSKNNILEKRYLAFEDYHRDASSVIDNYLVINNAKQSEIEHVKDLINNLCESIMAHPKTIVHRDFMPWNLQVNEQGKLFLIDFQDSLIASSEFDIVCLLHDRDIDFQLGDSFIKNINNFYQYSLNRKDDYKTRYYEILIHRYTRLTGHFHLLTKKTGKEVYANWVPGCIKRLARTIPNIPDFSDLIEIFAKYDKSIKLGSLKKFTL